jgi:hypothetical protein
MACIKLLDDERGPVLCYITRRFGLRAVEASYVRSLPPWCRCCPACPWRWVRFLSHLIIAERQRSVCFFR